MTKRRIAYACALALLLSTCLPAPAGSKGHSRGGLGLSAPPRPESISVSPPPEPARLLTVDPQLTALVQTIRARPNFSDAVIPGQLLNVRLVLPPELSGAAVTARRPAPRGVSTRTARPVSPGGGVGGTAAAAGLPFSNLALQVRWRVFETINNGRAALAENRDFQSPASTAAPAGSVLSRNFVMAPLRVVEYKGKRPTANPFLIVATVTVTADKIVPNPVPTLPPTTTPVTSAEVPLEVPLSLLDLVVPKVFVLFLDKKFGGAADLPPGEGGV